MILLLAADYGYGLSKDALERSRMVNQLIVILLRPYVIGGLHLANYCSSVSIIKL